MLRRSGYFTNYAGHDYSLILGSPAIDAGLASGGGAPAPVSDYLYNSRPVGGGYDTGSYEYNGTPLSPDTTPPTTPGTPSGTPGAYSIPLTWTASTDAREMWGYIVSRGGARIGFNMFANSFTDSTVVPGTTYSYTIAAIDTAFNVSSSSSAGSVTAYGVSGCLNSSIGSFRSVLIPPEAGTFEFTADVSPFYSATDAVFGLSPAAPAGYYDMAVQLAFVASGVLVVRNGAVYTADASYPYTSGTSYHLRIPVNVASHTYSVYASTGGPETLVASNYAFRTEQHAATSLAYLGATNDVSAPGAVAICSPALNGVPLSSMQFMPVSTQSLATQVISTISAEANGTGNPLLDRAQMTQLTGNYSAGAHDNGTLFYYLGSSPITVTVPSGLGTKFAVTIAQQSTGSITISAGSGVTLFNRNSATHTAGQGSPAVVQCTVANNCYLWGDVQ